MENPLTYIWFLLAPFLLFEVGLFTGNIIRNESCSKNVSAFQCATSTVIGFSDNGIKSFESIVDNIP